MEAVFRVFVALLFAACMATIAQAEAQRAPSGMRAAYIHLSPLEHATTSDEERDAQAAEILNGLNAAGFNTIFPYANRSNGAANYASNRVALSTAGEQDSLRRFAREARSRSLRVIPSVCVLVSGHDTPAGILDTHPEWALRTMEGKPIGWLSPAHPEARAWIVATLLEMLEHVEPDGMLLDYFRFPNKSVRLDPQSEARFEAMAASSESDTERAIRLQRFKEDALTQLLSEIQTALGEQRSKLQLGLYSWGAHVSRNHHVAQRWPDWVARGWLDFVNVSGYCYPENYGEDYLEVFRKRLADASTELLLAGGKATLSFALGLKTSHGAIGRAEDIASYIAIAEEIKLEGVAAFTWTSLEPFLPEVIERRYIADAFQELAPRSVRVFEADAHFGADTGQNFGTLFEARRASGESLAGAGFLGAYNTYYRADRHVLHAFVKPHVAPEKPHVRKLPRPSPHTHHYLFDAGEDIYATDRRSPEHVYRFDSQTANWVAAAQDLRPSFTVGDQRFQLSRNEIHRDNETILTFDPAVGAAGSYYFAQSHLFFHVALAASENRATQLYACPWNPAQDGTVDLESAIILDLTAPGEFPYAYGQLGDDIIVATNNGGIYRFREQQWKTLRTADPATSFQIYTMLNYYDRLLMGHYPSGELYELQGDAIVHLPGIPPRPQIATSRAREVQALSLYRGELFAGIWPWGEVWRLAEQGTDWHYLGRMFTHPAITPQITAPYEVELDALGEAVNNLWGQRITSLIPSNDGLFISTSNKNGVPFDDELTFLGEERWQEYGAVHALELPGHVSAEIMWKEQATHFQVILSDDWIVLRQDGRLLARAPLPAEHLASFQVGEVKWGEGIFGEGRMQFIETSATAP